MRCSRRPRTRRLRTFPLAAVAGLAATVGSAAASTPPVRPPSVVPAGLTAQVVSPHFIVHYAPAPADPNAITATEAQNIATTAEQSYTAETSSFGFPPPLDDGDGHIDIYIYDDPTQTESGLAHRDSTADTTSGWISINPHESGLTN